MDELKHSYILRLAAFAVIFLALALLERLAPRRRPQYPLDPRWVANLGLQLIDVGITRLLGPIAAVGVATWAEVRGFGLLRMFGISDFVRIAISLVALDLVIWTQHLVSHKIPLFWRLHRVHHFDRELDVTTGVRFHPLEIALSIVIKAGAVAILGAPVSAIIFFELTLNLVTLFNHANLGLPARVDRVLRWVCVTPDMHRVHHSIHREETDSNYGFNLPYWDWLFGTYRDQPRDGHSEMTLGLADWRADDVNRLSWLIGRSIFL